MRGEIMRAYVLEVNGLVNLRNLINFLHVVEHVWKFSDALL